MADQVLDRLNPHFCRLYPEGGRPSIPPEQLLLALLLHAIYGIRSERLLIEQLDYNLLFRWFIGLNPEDPVWHPTTFTKDRGRVLNEELMAKFLELLLERIDGLDDKQPLPSGGLQPDPHHQPAQKAGPTGGDGMKVSVKEPIAPHSEPGQASVCGNTH